MHGAVRVPSYTATCHGIAAPEQHTATLRVVAVLNTYIGVTAAAAPCAVHSYVGSIVFTFAPGFLLLVLNSKDSQHSASAKSGCWPGGRVR